MKVVNVKSCMAKKREQETFAIDLPTGRGCGLLLHFTTPIEICIDGKEYVLDKNACIYYPAGARTQYTAKRNVMYNSFAMFDVLDEEAFGALGLPGNQPFYVDDISSEQISLLYDEMTFLLVTKFGDEIALNLQRMLLEICAIMAKCAADPLIQDPADSQLHRKLRAIRKEMYSQSGKLSVEAAARELYFSRSYFSMVYKAFFGVSPKQDILNAKLEKACNLLLYTALKIDRIAAECNFLNTSSFIRFFIAQKQMTPTQFRKNILRCSVLFSVTRTGIVCIFAFGKNRGVARAEPREQHPTGVLHWIIRFPSDNKKSGHPIDVLIFW